MKAFFVRDLPVTSSGATQKLWRCEPPYEGREFVITSAVVAFDFGPETYIFPSNESGEVASWNEMSGSFRGSRDHERAIREAGYEPRLRGEL